MNEHTCEAGMFEACKKPTTMKCPCCDLWLCDEHLAHNMQQVPREQYMNTYEFEVKRTVISHHVVTITGEDEAGARATLAVKLTERFDDTLLGDEQEREEEFAFSLLDTDDEDQS